MHFILMVSITYVTPKSALDKAAQQQTFWWKKEVLAMKIALNLILSDAVNSC